MKPYPRKVAPKFKREPPYTREEEMKLHRRRMAENQQGAKQLLKVEKAAEKAAVASPTPMLGRGFSLGGGGGPSSGDGGFIDLSAPMVRSPSAPAAGANSRARAAQLLKARKCLLCCELKQYQAFLCV